MSDIKTMTLARYKAHDGGDPVKAAFDHVGGGDHELVGLTSRELLDQYAPVPPGGTLIDIGCGPGRLARYLKDRDIRYIGTDVVPEVLSVAKAQVGRDDWRFVEVAGYEVPVPPNSADVVALLGVFTNMHVEVAARILCNAAKALRPGGKVLITYFDIMTHRHYFKAFVDSFEKRHEPLGFLSPNFLEAMASAAGLLIEKVDPPQPINPAEGPHMLLDGRVHQGPLSQVLSVCVMSKPRPAVSLVEDPYPPYHDGFPDKERL